MRLISIAILSLLLMLTFSTARLSCKNLFEDAHDFDAYQKTLSKEYVETKIKKALEGDAEINRWYLLTEHEFVIYASPEDKLNHRAEFTLELGSKKRPKKEFPPFQNPHTPLKGLRVAIDPGHMGGKLAHLEEKYVHMLPNEEKGIYEEIKFNEGELAITTAKRLANKLKALGATVLLTKVKSGEPVLRSNFDDWKSENFESAVAQLVLRQPDPLIQSKEALWWKEKAPLSQIFRSTYNFLDIERRAELINAFKPHVTIACHYNLGGGYNKEGYTIGTDTDYTLFFVPGAFEKGDLKDEVFRKASLKNDRSRYEFVRLLVTEDIEQSVALASITSDYTSEILNLPLAKMKGWMQAIYPDKAAGVFHRNLMLARLTHAPILYCEPFLQDNYEQTKILYYNKDRRIDEMVQIYTQSILDWTRWNQD
ncbi:MAG: hypothetical protein S4CHLAM7_11940 [Chlamydiae bacterium]|nr:hypothetical protein [Chlamydiota bacterium]